MESKIFTKTELTELEKRLKGKKENYKIWYRVKPKILELFEWFKKRKELKKLIEVKK